MFALFSLKGNAFSLMDSSNIGVKIFDQVPVYELRITTDTTELTITSDTRTAASLKPTGDDLTIEARNSGIAWTLNGREREASKLTLSVPAGKTMTVHVPGHNKRIYPDQLVISEHNGHLSVLNITDLELYVAGVIAAEMNFEKPHALNTQAVIARTYALWFLEQHNAGDRHLVDHTENQVYRGIIPSRPEFRQAARATRGEVLTHNNELILAAYSSTCGGTTSSNKDYWQGRDLPYLSRVADGGACEASPHYRWNFTADADSFYAELSEALPYSVTGITPADKDQSGRWKTVSLDVKEQNEAVEISGVRFRNAVIRRYDIYALRSMKFTLHQSGGKLTFSGSGMGHGIGLCQWGAKGLAEAGWSYREILRFYYNDVELTNYHNL